MMPLPKFKLERPRSLSESLRCLADHPDALPLAGGTDLLVSMKHGLYDAPLLVDVKKLKELSSLETTSEGVFLGAGLKLAAVRDNGELQQQYTALSEAAGMVASPNIQNMGTLGGNVCLNTRCWYLNQSEFWRSSKGFCLKKEGTLCQAAPGAKRCFAAFSSDTVPALIALGGEAELAHWGGEGVVQRHIPLEELYRDEGINRITLNKGELLVGIRLPASAGVRSGYMKYRKRGAIDYPLAAVAVALKMVDGRMSDVRIVLGALASAPVCAHEAMELLEGAQPSAELFARAVEQVGKRTCPVKNQAGTPGHRKQMARVYCQRLLTRLTTKM